MKKIFWLIFYSMVIFNVYGQSRLYRPVSEMENSWYIDIDKTIWPYDVKENLTNFQNTLVGWVGIIEKINIVVTDNDEYNIIQYYVKHHYYDWIEDFGPGNQPIRLSPDGEGFIVFDYYIRKAADIIAFTQDAIGNCVIVYGYPRMVLIEDNVIIVELRYLRIIDKQYVNPSWLRYGRNGFDILN